MATRIGKSRLEAFSDGVVAIIITIMVLELRAPQGRTFADLGPLLPMLLSYALSFTYVGIYWNNHNHLLRATSSVNGLVMWANLHLLFWLSLIPFATTWMDSSGFAREPVAAYGVILFLTAVAFKLLATLLVRHEGKRSSLAAALGRDWKTTVSLSAYGLAAGAAFLDPHLALVIFVVVAGVWFIPDRRITRAMHSVWPSSDTDP